MINQQSAQKFTQQLLHCIPHIQQVQLLTTDGLVMHTTGTRDNEDKQSALSAMLYSAAQQLADCVTVQESHCLIVCLDNSTYLLTRFGDDMLVGMQVSSPSVHIEPQLTQMVCDLMNKTMADHFLDTQQTCMAA